MFLYVLSLNDKKTLEGKGYEHMATRRLGNKTVYIFKNNNTLRFDSLEVKVFQTDTLYF